MFIRPVGRDRLPQDREADALDAELGDAIDILRPEAMSCLDVLIAPAVAHAHDRALRATP
jgi:hypothetical protein